MCKTLTAQHAKLPISRKDVDIRGFVVLEAIITSSCSPDIHPAIVNAIVKTESGFNPFAIGVNRGAGYLAKQPTSYDEAVSVAKQLLANGADIDMGLGQINSANMKWLNLTVEQAFHPCSNLKALQTVYLHCYDKAGANGNGTRMQRAWSCYNTGNTQKGFSNGYVAKVTNNYNALLGYANASPKNPYQNTQQITYQQYDVVGRSTNAIDSIQNISATQVPNDVQNANMGVSVRSDDIPQQPPVSELTNETPVKVFHGWDVFRDF